MVITKIMPLKNGKVQLFFDSAEPLQFYRSELSGFAVKEQMEIDRAFYEKLYYEILGKRVTKRAMHLLEKTDRTEEQLRRKLREGAYPEELIEKAVAYVKSYHYVDDERYARAYVRLNQDSKSSGRMRRDLLSRGVKEEVIALALEEENETEPEILIRRLLEKRHYDPAEASLQEMQRNYRFLAGRGFRAEDIMHVLKKKDG